MATTKTITPIKPLALALGNLALLLVAIAVVNLFSSFTPFELKNHTLSEQIVAASQDSSGKNAVALSDLRQEQEKLLVKKPADPFAWGRLSYLRGATQGDPKAAFEALRMSDMVSPYEPRQLVERALMWRGLRTVQTDDEKAYQKVLWQKAVALEGKDTWDMAVEKGLVKEIEDALQSGDPKQLERWKQQEAATGHTN